MATSSELKEALKKAADTIAKYVEDAATMTVETYIVDTSSGGSSKLAASSEVRLDGDSKTTLPMKPGPDGLVVDTLIYDLHQQNVQAAIDYRAEMMDKLLGILQGG